MNVGALNKNNEKLGEYVFYLYSLYTDLYLLKKIMLINVSYIMEFSFYRYNIFLIKYCNFQILNVHRVKKLI